MLFPLESYAQKNTKAASLAVFRVLFGLVMTLSMVRFWLKGWIEELYLIPKFHFHYTGFEFLNVPGSFTYLLFFICGLSALMVSLGFKYRIAIVLFFLSFIYIELLDKTTYLNHYYFVSVVSFILIFLPANCSHSLDAIKDSKIRTEFIPAWNVDVLKLMIAIVYVYAGFAKLNYDWMFSAMPLSIWLPTKFDFPILGGLMDEKWMHYLFSWSGAAYDIFIVFLLIWKRTRVFAFVIVVLFHLMTSLLFPIGMFPYLMIASTLIFFSAEFHEKLLSSLSKPFGFDSLVFKNGMQFPATKNQFRMYVLVGFMVFQLLFPLRHFIYTDNVFWTEQGYRFSWRVMLMEKTGYANFKIVDGLTKKRFYVQNDDFLTALQQKEMSTQPDFILEYGQFLGQHFSKQGHQNVEVYVESYAALNGRKNQKFIKSNVDLMKIDYQRLCQSYITPLND